MTKSDTFRLYDLKVTVVGNDNEFVCGHHAGDYFLVQGENIVFPEEKQFSMYSLSTLLPLLPAKQRSLDDHDWMFTDTLIACPDSNCKAQFKIERMGERTLHHSETTVVPLQ